MTEEIQFGLLFMASVSILIYGCDLVRRVWDNPKSIRIKADNDNG